MYSPFYIFLCNSGVTALHAIYGLPHALYIRYTVCTIGVPIRCTVLRPTVYAHHIRLAVYGPIFGRFWHLPPPIRIC